MVFFDLSSYVSGIKSCYESQSPDQYAFVYFREISLEKIEASLCKMPLFFVKNIGISYSD